jgi:hypothetical protein
MLNEKIAAEASRGARWRPPLLIFIGWCFFSAMFNFSTQAPVHGAWIYAVFYFFTYF